MPHRARIHYNLGLLYQQHQDLVRAEQKLAQALRLDPENLEFQYALADHYIKRRLFEQAIPIVQTMIATHPNEQIGPRMLQFIQSQMDP